jgi:hypothetical protein
LRDKTKELISADNDPPALKLDDLRGFIDNNVDRHLKMKSLIGRDSVDESSSQGSR